MQKILFAVFTLKKTADYLFLIQKFLLHLLNILVFLLLLDQHFELLVLNDTVILQKIRWENKTQDSYLHLFFITCFGKRKSCNYPFSIPVKVLINTSKVLEGSHNKSCSFKETNNILSSSVISHSSHP